MTADSSTLGCDLCVVGGGIVGLATAWKWLQAHPGSRVVVLEADQNVGMHQSGRNSGVLHSGVYYKPGSLKAVLCRRGKLEMQSFCTEHDVPFELCGKVIVATTAAELVRLDEIERRGRENGVNLRRIDSDELRELEPAVAGVAAVHVPESGIVDYQQVCHTLRRCIENAGSQVLTQSRVTSIQTRSGKVRVAAKTATVESSRLVNCAGLHCDRVLKLAGGTSQVQIIPFRGEYFELAEGQRALCRNLIYPVPDPAFPFLGVHFTRMIGGGVECGPNAVLALAREGYRWRDLRVHDLWETLRYPGFRRLAAAHWKMGVGEMWRSVNKDAFVRALQKLIPAVRNQDLKPARAGVRAQAVDASGRLVDDFLIEHTDRAIHVLNAPSPAATASLAIAQHIVDLAVRL